MNLHRLLVIVLFALGMVAVAPRAFAQGGALDDSLISADEIKQDQKDKIRAYVDANKDGLRAEAVEIRRSRNALLQPLTRPNISVPFRIEYTRQLSPVLRPLIADANEVIAVNALRIVGELATANAVDLLVDALKDKRPGVRYTAASGYKDTFKAMQSTVPAMGGAAALKMLDTVRTTLEAEKDPRVLEGLVGAFQEALKIPNAQIEGMRGEAVEALAKAISKKTEGRKIGPEADAALRKAVLAIRTSTVTNVNINEPQLKPETVRLAAGMAGDLLALVMERLKAPGATTDSDLALMVSESERAIYFMAPALGGADLKETKLGDLIQQGKAEEYQQKVLQIIGPNGVLTADPFKFPDNRFVK